ncbi:O-antigen ligase family protein [Halomonas sp. BLK-85]
MNNNLFMKKISKNCIPASMIWLFGVVAFTQVTFIPIYVYYLSFFSLVGTLFLYSLSQNVRIDKNLTAYFSLFLSCFFIGVVSYPISIVIEKRFNYSDMQVFGRMINLALLFIVFILIHSFHRKTGEILQDYFLVIRAYQLGIFIVMLIGAWQFISFYSSIPFPFETRSHLHSTYGSNYSFSQRLTSVAREPSFFVMLAIDFIGLSLLFYSGLKRKSMVALGLVMVVFSLSPSGFITLIGAAVAAWGFSEIKYFSGKIKIKKIVFFIIGAAIFSVFILMNEQIFEYIYGRIFNAAPSNSGRFYMIVMPYLWSIEGSLFNILFGYGVKSYSIIGSYYSLPSGVPVHITSNNIYTDIFWESGLIGFMLLISFFVLVFVRIFRSKIGKTCTFIAFYFIFEIMFSSLFRADYSSARFFIILYTIYLITESPIIRRRHSENSCNYT